MGDNEKKGIEMIGTKIAIAITVLMLAANAFADDSSPKEVLKKVAATYKTLKTYKTQGTITSDIETT